MYRSHLKASWAAILAIVAVAGSAAVSQAAKPGGSAYATYDLHPGEAFVESYARDINAQRQVVGWARGETGTRGVCWNPSSGGFAATLLAEEPALPGTTGARAVNDATEIVGWGDFLVSEGNQVVERGRAMFWASPTSVPLVLPTPPGFNECHAVAINNDGIVVGVARQFETRTDTDGNVRNGVVAEVGVAWRIRQALDGPMVSATMLLPGLFEEMSVATAANDAIEGLVTVVGMSESPIFDNNGLMSGEFSTAVRWNLALASDGGLIVTPPIELETPGGPESLACGINAGDQACGTTTSSDGSVIGYTGTRTLSKLRNTFFERESVRDLNDAGDAVGQLTDSRSIDWIGVLWTNGSAKTLTSLMGKSSFSSLDVGQAINGRGDIVGDGWSLTNATHAFVMTKN